MSFADVGTARVDGAEIVAEWAPVSSLRFEAQATLLDSGARSPTLPGSIDPKVTYSLRGIVDLSDAVRLDLGWRSVSKLEGLGVKGYDSFDARIAWQPVPSVELALSAENVLDDEHVEFSDDLRLAPGIEIGRTVFARFTWRPH
jgi:iron complex outermembrane receptor protein